MTFDLTTIINLVTVIIAIVASYVVMKNELKHAKDDISNLYRLIEVIQRDCVTDKDLKNIDKHLEKIDKHLQILLEEKINGNPCKTCSKT